MGIAVSCQNISKRYQYQWIIRGCNWHFAAGSITGIQGPNGSGKSTLLRILSTQLTPSTGMVEYRNKMEVIQDSDIFKSLSLVGPYTNLIQEFTIREMFDFHFKFKGKRGQFSYQDFREKLQLSNVKHKRIGEYSSGMNQRLQLGLAIMSDTSLLLMDEPTSFLDSTAREWYHDILKNNKSNRTIIISSNEVGDFRECQEVYQVDDLKAIP